ncbi:hypothetical protein K7X08_028957 [Anisodus acutangulus]|uniref:Uncharacterized protein n=1 Tax=Anisodus acutangulus TaxID=402998 RepID=A0A9Q1L167_9SOLA|nr:hypothetical protein K7X08_028957 [Anisodus acutangulus]
MTKSQRREVFTGCMLAQTGKGIALAQYRHTATSTQMVYRDGCHQHTIAKEGVSECCTIAARYCSAIASQLPRSRRLSNPAIATQHDRARHTPISARRWLSMETKSKMVFQGDGLNPQVTREATPNDETPEVAMQIMRAQQRTLRNSLSRCNGSFQL